MDEDQKPEPKISFTWLILGTIFFVVCDLIDLIPFGGEATDIPEGIVDLFMVFSGLGPIVAITDGITLVLKLIPFVQALPLGTISFAIAVWIDRHPSKITSVIEKGAEITSVVEGNVGSLEGAEGEMIAAENAAREASAIEATEGVGAAVEAGGGVGSGRDIDPEAFGQKRELLGKEGELNRELLPDEIQERKLSKPEDEPDRKVPQETPEERRLRKAQEFKDRLDAIPRPPDQPPAPPAQPKNQEEEENQDDLAA